MSGRVGSASHTQTFCTVLGRNCVVLNAYRYWVQRCYAGEEMRSHVGLYFENVDNKKAISWDFTAEQFAAFGQIEDPNYWYAKYTTAKVYMYELSVDVDKLYQLAQRFTEYPPPYSHAYKLNTVCPWYPWRCCSCGSVQNRPTNCVGATMTVIAMVKGATSDPKSVMETLKLDHTAEWLMPSYAVKQLQKTGIINDCIIYGAHEKLPLLMVR